MIIIDSDVLIEIYDKNSTFGERALQKIIDSGDTFCITSITLHEVLYGLMKYAGKTQSIMQLPTLSYSKDDAKLAAELELKSEKAGKKVARTDIMIAAIAINNNAKLYTNDKKHFSGIKELELF